jgi:hypothetical protein
VADGRYVLYSLIEDDEFTKTLWQIYQEVKREGYVQVRCHEAFKAGSETALPLLVYLLLHMKFLNFLTCPFLASLDWWDTSHSGRGMQSFFAFRFPADGEANRKSSLCAFDALGIGDNHRRTAFAPVEHVIIWVIRFALPDSLSFSHL